MAVRVPVTGPFPDVAGHVEKAEPVRWVRADRRRAAVARGRLARGSRRASSGRVVPRLARARRPRCRWRHRGRRGRRSSHSASVGRRFPDQVAYAWASSWATWTTGCRRGPRVTSRALGVLPAGAWRPCPPLAQVPEVDGAGGAGEDERSGDEVLRRGARGSRRGRALARRRFVAGGVDELGELPLVTGVASIQSPSTVTLCTGASSG